MFPGSGIVWVNGLIHDDFWGCGDEVLGDDTVKDDEDDEREDVQENDDHDEEGDLPVRDGLGEALVVDAAVFSGDGVMLRDSQDGAAREENRIEELDLQKLV